MISKKTIILCTAIALLPALCTAGMAQQITRIFLFADENHCIYEVTNPGVDPYEFELWIWWHPGQNGMMAGELAVSYPSNVIASWATENPEIPFHIGDLLTGESFCFSTCQIDWIWSHRQICYLIDTERSYIELVPHPGVGMIHIANCLDGYPSEPVNKGNPLLLNHSIATEKFSWGAIKSLF